MTEALDQREEDQKLEKNNLFVGNLDGRIRRRHLKEFFSQFGEVVFTKVAFNKETRRSRGFGFVIFKEDQDAQRAYQQANGAVVVATDKDGNEISFEERQIRCEFAVEREDGEPMGE